MAFPYNIKDILNITLNRLLAQREDRHHDTHLFFRLVKVARMLQPFKVIIDVPLVTAFTNQVKCHKIILCMSNCN